MSELTELKNKNKVQIDKLNENVDRLNQINHDHEHNNKILNQEKNSLQKRLDDLNFENNSNISKLKAKEDALTYTKVQLEETSKNLNKQQVNFLHF